MLDAFHIVKLAGDALDEVRRRVQQDTTGHRGRKGDPLYQIRLLLRAPRDRLTPRQQERLREAFTADEAHISVEVAYLLTQQVREVFHQATPAQGQRLAAHLIQRLPACPIPEIARLGRTLRKWKDAFLAYFDTGGASNGPTEAINGIIELGRRTARGYRNPTNYKLRMLLIAGGLDASTHTQLGRAGKPPTFPSTPQKSDRSDAATQIETTAMSLRGRTISAPAVTRGNLGVELIC